MTDSNDRTATESSPTWDGIDLETSATIGRRYVVVQRIARGGMGTVYEVRHSITGNRWALKVLGGSRSRAKEARTLERFRLEAQVLRV